MELRSQRGCRIMQATKEDANKGLEIGDCIIYGRNLRTIFLAVVAREDRAHWAIFIVDIGAPFRSGRFPRL